MKEELIQLEYFLTQFRIANYRGESTDVNPKFVHHFIQFVIPRFNPSVERVGTVDVNHIDADFVANGEPRLAQRFLFIQGVVPHPIFHWELLVV